MRNRKGAIVPGRQGNAPRQGAALAQGHLVHSFHSAGCILRLSHVLVHAELRGHTGGAPYHGNDTCKEYT